MEQGTQDLKYSVNVYIRLLCPFNLFTISRMPRKIIPKETQNGSWLPLNLLQNNTALTSDCRLRTSYCFNLFIMKVKALCLCIAVIQSQVNAVRMMMQVNQIYHNKNFKTFHLT